MANIPVERKGGTPWWTWLLALLAIIGLIWLIAELFDTEPDEDDLAVVDPVESLEQPEPIETDTEITSFAGLAGGTALIGREVDLDSMRVFTLTGDSSFFAGPGPGADQGALIVLQGMNESESLPPPPTGRDGEYNIDDTDVVSIEGVIAGFDATVPDYADLPAEDRERALREGIYINANDVRVMDNMNGDGM